MSSPHFHILTFPHLPICPFSHFHICFLSYNFKIHFMQKQRYIRILFFFVFSIFCVDLRAQDSKPDTVQAGIYITSIHDIDFKEKEYTTNLWIWLKYKNKDFDFYNNLEIPQAKTVTKSFVTIDSSNGRIYLLMKLQCVMKDSWRIGNFPFDRQNLRLFYRKFAIRF